MANDLVVVRRQVDVNYKLQPQNDGQVELAHYLRYAGYDLPVKKFVRCNLFEDNLWCRH